MAKKLTLEYVKQKIKELHSGCEVLDQEYINSKTKLNIICENGHNLTVSYNELKNKKWCAECYGNKKGTIEVVFNFIKNNYPEAKLISTEYINYKSKLDLICEKGHSFKITCSDLKKGYWCAECAGNKKHTIEDVLKFIKINYPKAKLLSTEYIYYKTKLNLICESGHSFKLSYDHIKRGVWCSECSNCKKNTIEDVISFIKNNHPKAKLLSTEYKNNNTKLNLICEKGHDFNITYKHLKRGVWCPTCFGNKKKTIKDVIIFINKKHSKAKVISNIYVNSISKLDLICENGHNFKISYNNIKIGQWCSECSGKKKKTIKDVIILIKKNHPEAKLLSKEYKNNNTKLNLICENGHPFMMSYDCIRNGYWCPICAGSKGEELVRKVFEDKFKKLFPNIKPKWLKNPKTNCLLQLDGFCEELKLAFEYQGKQHYEYPNYYHKTKKQFEAQKYRDKIKKNLCKENNVILIEIKEIKDLSYENVELIVNSVLKEKDIIK